MEEVILKIDKLLLLVTQKGIKSPLSFEDLRLTLILTLVKLELSFKRKISDFPFSAMVTIAGCSYQNYMGLEDEIHQQIISIEESLYQFSENPLTDIETPSCHNKKEWEIYLKKIMEELLSFV